MKNERFWNLFNYYIMCYEGNEQAAYGCAKSDLGYEPTEYQD